MHRRGTNARLKRRIIHTKEMVSLRWTSASKESDRQLCKVGVNNARCRTKMDRRKFAVTENQRLSLLPFLTVGKRSKTTISRYQILKKKCIKGRHMQEKLYNDLALNTCVVENCCPCHQLERSPKSVLDFSQFVDQYYALQERNLHPFIQRNKTSLNTQEHCSKSLLSCQKRSTPSCWESNQSVRQPCRTTS